MTSQIYVDFEYCTYITTMNIKDKIHKINVTDIIGTLAHSMNKLNIAGNSRNNIRVNSVCKSYIMIQMLTFCLLCCKFEQFKRHTSLVTDMMSVCTADECAQLESNTEKRNSVGYEYKNDQVFYWAAFNVNAKDLTRQRHVGRIQLFSVICIHM